MAYPDKVLAADEQVVAHIHPHWTTLAPATGSFVVICAAAGVGTALLPAAGTGRLAGVLAIVVLGLTLLVRLVLVPWLRWRCTHYVFTTHRVTIRRGVFTHRGRDIAYRRISDVGFEQSLWERIVRSGTIMIESAGEQGQEVLRHIPRSDQTQQLLNRLIEQDDDRRARQGYGFGGAHWDQPPDSDFPTQTLPQRDPSW